MTTTARPLTIRQALAQAPRRYVRPTACLTCGAQLAPSRPAYCSTACAVAARG